MPDNLKELVNSPGWTEYCDWLEEAALLYFSQLLTIDATDPSSIAKIIELKSKISCLQEISYLIEREFATPETVSMIDKSYGVRLQNLLKKIWRR